MSATVAKKIGPPKVRPRVRVSVEIEQTYDDRWNGGSMHMTFQDTALDASIGGTKVATVIGCLGSGTEIQLSDEHGRTFFLNSKDLLESVLAALGLSNEELAKQAKKRHTRGER